MHHVRIALDEHQPVDFHRTIFAHAAQIVAPQIDEHDVFGAFFGIGQQLRFELAVFIFVAPSRPRSGEGPVKRIAPLDLHEHFRRTADHGNIVQASRNKDRARDSRPAARDRSQTDRRSFSLKIAGSRRLETHRPRECRIFALRTAPTNCDLRHVRLDTQRPRAPRAPFGRQRLFERPPRALDFADRRVIFLAQAAGPSVNTLRMTQTRCCTWSNAIRPR